MKQKTNRWCSSNLDLDTSSLFFFTSPSLQQAGADNLIHFQWLERMDAGALAPLAAGPPATPELDIIIMPEEKAKLTRMPRPPGTRIFKLSFGEGGGDASRDLFLWAQEPDAASDDASVESFNRALNTTIDVVMGSDGEDDDDDDDDESDDGEGPISAAYLSAVLRGLGMPPPQARPTGPRPPTQKKAKGASGGAGGAGGGGQVDARALAAALAAAAGGGGGSSSGAQLQQQQQQEALREMLRAAASGPSLGEILRPDLLLPLLFSGAGEGAKESVDAIVERLSQHAPAGHRARGREGVEELASSAQLRSQADAFSSALTSGELDLSHFGLRAKGFSVADFLQAVQDSVDAEKEKKKREEEEGKGGGGQQQEGGGAAGGGGTA